MADLLSTSFGSWTFILVQSVVVVAWIAVKVIIGIVSSIFWIVLAVVVVFAVIWAVVTLRS